MLRARLYGAQQSVCSPVGVTVPVTVLAGEQVGSAGVLLRFSLCTALVKHTVPDGIEIVAATLQLVVPE
jgi:hypothetical protein